MSNVIVATTTHDAPTAVCVVCCGLIGICAVELCHASHLWYPLFYTSPMASGALQH